MPRKVHVLSYRLHCLGGRATVTLDRKDVYLGVYGPPASKAEYERVVAESLARHHSPADVRQDDGVSPAEVMLPSPECAGTYFRDADGDPTSEASSIRYAPAMTKPPPTAAPAAGWEANHPASASGSPAPTPFQGNPAARRGEPTDPSALGCERARVDGRIRLRMSLRVLCPHGCVPCR